MRSSIRLIPFVFLAALLGVSGCQKVSATKTYTMNPGDIQYMEVDGPSREQDVTITVDSSGPIDVYLASKKDADDAVAKAAPPKASISSKKAITKDSVTGKVPAKTAYGAVLVNPKNKDTKVTITLKGE